MVGTHVCHGVLDERGRRRPEVHPYYAAALVCALTELAPGQRATLCPAGPGVHSGSPGGWGLVVSGWGWAQVFLPGCELCRGVLRPCRSHTAALVTQTVDCFLAARLGV